MGLIGPKIFQEGAENCCLQEIVCLFFPKKGWWAIKKRSKHDSPSCFTWRQKEILLIVEVSLPIGVRDPNFFSMHAKKKRYEFYEPVFFLSTSLSLFLFDSKTRFCEPN